MYEMNNVEKSPLFHRTNSQICPSPEDELFEAVLKNDTGKVRSLVLKNRALLNYIYTPEYNKPILLIACRNDKVEAKTVKTLLDLGADPRDYDETDGQEALHLAAHKTDSNTIRVLLDKDPNAINSLTKRTESSPGGNNALHELIRYGNSNSNEFLKCAEILISNGININQGDAKYVSPILWAAKKGQKDMVKLILEKGGAVDLDSHNIRGQTARDIIGKDKELPQPCASDNLIDKDNLFAYLKQGDEEKFINYKNGDIDKKLANEDDTNSTLLQIACEKGLFKAVEYLIEKGADSNETCNKQQISRLPIWIAASHGYADIFALLLQKTKPPSGILHLLLKNIDNRYHDTKKCYDLLMERIKNRWKNEPDSRNEIIVMLNEKDGSGNTPLHYAVRYADEDTILELLELGASLGSKNHRYNDHMPIENIDPEILEHHLDNCVKFDSKKKYGDEYEVTLDYRSIIPPHISKKKSKLQNKFDVESNALNEEYTNQLVEETEIIHFMSNSKEYRHLLIHPVIVSFLLMKWKKVQWIFMANLIFYITFSLSLVAYIFTDYLYPEDLPKSNGLNVLGKISYVLLLVGFIILTLRETFQIFVAPINYMKGFENYIEIFLIILTGIILFKDSISKKQVASVAILLAVFECMLMLGPHPCFSTRVEMLKKVMLTFFKFLIWYVWLIVAFALSFYILFAPNIWSENNSGPNVNKTEVEDDNNKLFETPGKSVFKTVIMLTGEFDSSDLDFQTFPVTSALIFSLFIFMIAIILLNLLNGLAVSDTQKIKQESELIGHIMRANYLRHIERMLEGNVIPVGILDKIRDVCCCFPRARNLNWSVKNHVSNCAYLFPNYLNYELTFYPDKDGLVNLPQHECNSCGSCDTCLATYLDKKTVKRTNIIIQARKEGQPKIERELELIKETLNRIMRELNQGQ